MEEAQIPIIKQVIVMRHDLKMRRGKQIAQGRRTKGSATQSGYRIVC